MYILLLAARYLRTRFIALASVVSVMLGVATMIIVNSVMSGFSEQMRDRIHNILADVTVETVVGTLPRLPVEVAATYRDKRRGPGVRVIWPSPADNREVTKPGSNIIVADGRGYAISDGPAKPIASMTGTMMVVRGREDIAE